MGSKSPWVAAALSLVVPGLGQLYNGERAKGTALICIAAGIAGGILLATAGPLPFRSWLTPLMLGAICPFVWVPAILDARRRAVGLGSPLLAGEKVWYVVVMLLTVGPMALPLLWQSRRFSRAAKIGWTIAVIALAIGGILLVVAVGPALEHLQQGSPALGDLLR